MESSLSVADPAPTAVAPEAAQRMLDYLVFHRSLLGEGEEEKPRLLERYLSLVQNLKEGVHVVIPDPYQKATALLFELVMEEEFDPWEIDLVKFTQSYLERVRAEGGVDFAVAGRLLYMAWSILYLQSKEILESRDHPETPAELDAAAIDDSYLPAMDSPEALDVTQQVLTSPNDPPLIPMVRHSETRPVSLLELVQAFGQAELDAKRALRVEELRERLREEQHAPPEVLVHGDIPVRDLDDTWAIALEHPADARFPFLDIWGRSEGRDRLVALFLACLFLARENAVRLDQERIGETPLFIVRLTDHRPAKVEE